MRNDMDRVVTERPRTGGRGKTRNRFNKIFTPDKRYNQSDEEWDYLEDERPTKATGRRKAVVDGDFKVFSDLINPLIRFLRSNVGRPWDKVWSEICAVLKGSGVQAQHIKDHIKMEVDGHVSFPGKTRPTPQYRAGTGYYPYHYVDEHGILRYYPGKKKPKYRSVGPAPKNFTCEFCGAENLTAAEMVRHTQKGQAESDKEVDLTSYYEAKAIVDEKARQDLKREVERLRKGKKDR